MKRSPAFPTPSAKAGFRIAIKMHEIAVSNSGVICDLFTDRVTQVTKNMNIATANMMFTKMPAT
jgi:hypothetical protein